MRDECERVTDRVVVLVCCQFHHTTGRVAYYHMNAWAVTRVICKETHDCAFLRIDVEVDMSC